MKDERASMKLGGEGGESMKDELASMKCGKNRPLLHTCEIPLHTFPPPLHTFFLVLHLISGLGFPGDQRPY